MEEEKLDAVRKQRRDYQKKKWKCDICDLVIDIGSKSNHLRRNAHRDNNDHAPAKLCYEGMRLARCSPKITSWYFGVQRYIFGISTDTKNKLLFLISCAYRMEPISLSSLATMKCINDCNTEEQKLATGKKQRINRLSEKEIEMRYFRYRNISSLWTCSFKDQCSPK